MSQPSKIGDSIHFHAYSLLPNEKNYTLNLESRLSTDTAGVASCLGLQANSNIEMKEIIKKIGTKNINKNFNDIVIVHSKKQRKISLFLFNVFELNTPFVFHRIYIRQINYKMEKAEKSQFKLF